MSRRLRVDLTATITLTALFALTGGVRADTPETNLGKKVKNFTLKDAQGQTVSLEDFKDKKAVVIVFLGTECPINNLYLPTLNQLHKDFADKSVQILGINSNRQDTIERIAAHVKKHALAFPVLQDKDNRIADLLQARRTPEAFVLDQQRKIRYQGRIDDQFGIGSQRPQPTRRDLVEALTEVLAGKPVSQATTAVAGCKIGRVSKADATGEITYTKHVAPILQKNCQECHRPGQIGPFALLTYEVAAAWSETIREVIAEDRMPPWHADPKFGKFSNDRRLTKEEKATLLTWLDKGTPRGDPKDLPPPRKFTDGWRIGKPDAVITMPVEFDVPAKMPKYGVPYKHFAVTTNFPEDRWIVQAEAKPGAPEVVHHIIVFVVPPGRMFIPGDPKTPPLCGTAPGDMPLQLPPGYAKHIPKGARLIFQMHYTPNGKAIKDRSSIGLVFAKEPPKKSVVTEPVYNLFFSIPAGAANHKVEASYRCRQDGEIIGFMPHMHLRGKDFLYQALYPDGKSEVLLSVPKYNFNWQSVYRPATPIGMPKGTRLQCIAHFDNSDKNPNNPDPTRTVTWGDQTWQEMLIGWVDFAYDIKAK
jgi:peroxiredoxin